MSVLVICLIVGLIFVYVTTNQDNRVHDFIRNDCCESDDRLDPEWLELQYPKKSDSDSEFDLVEHHRDYRED